VTRITPQCFYHLLIAWFDLARIVPALKAGRIALLALQTSAPISHPSMSPA